MNAFDFSQKPGSSPSLSIVIPTFNERENITAAIPQLADAFGDVSHEIIVVDDSSPDGTANAVLELIRRFTQVRLEKRQGKGGMASAISHGYDIALGEIILSSDADLSYPPGDLLKVYRTAASGYDLVVGSRHSPSSFYEALSWESRLRRLASYLENKIIRFLFRIPVSDYFANCRAIRKSLWEKLSLDAETPFFLLEMILAAKEAGGRIAEVPVAFRERRMGHSKINHLVVIPGVFASLIIFSFRRLLGRLGSSKETRIPGI